MFELFTDEARDIVVAAQAYARAARHDSIAAEDLLLAALSAPGAGPATVRWSAGLEIDAPAAPDGLPLPFSDEARRALDWGVREALSLGAPRVEIAHVLVGLLRDEPAAAAVLEGLGEGLMPAELRRAVLADLGAPLGDEPGDALARVLLSAEQAAEEQRRNADAGDLVVAAAHAGGVVAEALASLGVSAAALTDAISRAREATDGS